MLEDFAALCTPLLMCVVQQAVWFQMAGMNVFFPIGQSLTNIAEGGGG